MGALEWGLFFGTAVGVGLFTCVWVYYGQRLTMSRRLYAWSRGSAAAQSSRWAAIKILLNPSHLIIDKILDSVGSTKKSVNSRMRYAAMSGGVRKMRVIQVLCAGTGFACTLLVLITLLLTRGVSVWIMPVVLAISVLLSLMLPDQWLTVRANSRQTKIGLQIPDCAELLSLSVSAGEGISEALGRVTGITPAPLRTELEQTVGEMNSGITITQSIANLRSRNRATALVRFCDALLLALERGAPLSEMLRTQAHDTREAARRQLIEEGGRKEIAMLVPVVFLILPITVIFALYPGLVSLHIDF